MFITKEQWNMLDDEQKKLFQEEVGKEFNESYPDRNDILIFLNNNKLSTNLKDLKNNETPPVIKEIDKLWEDIVNFFKK